MKETIDSDTDATGVSNNDDTQLELIRTAVDALLGRVRRHLTRSTTAASGQHSSPVIIADGGQDSAKIIGHNKTDSGQTVGVWGQVDSPDGCGFATPDDARIDGALIGSSLTGGKELTNLTGSGLAINSGSLEVTGGSSGGLWEKQDDNLLTPADSGVEGIDVDSATLDGTIDTNETDFIVEAGTPTTEDARNVVLGHYSNNVAGPDGGAEGVTIAGGGFDDGSSDNSHVAYDNYGTIGGGVGNQVGADDGMFDQPGGTVGGGGYNTASGEGATVGGGESNTASDLYSTIGGGGGNTVDGTGATVGGGGGNIASGAGATVGGGGKNTASGEDATVAGGDSNTASGPDATVGGGEANTAGSDDATVPGGALGAAESDESFVWNDGSSYHAIPNTDTKGLSSNTAVNGEPVTGASTFSVSAQGGVRFITGSSSVTYIDGGTAGWSTSSSRAAKINIDPIDPQQVLDGVEDVEVATWEYKNDDGDGAGTTHVGPMAEEFHGILDTDLGSSDKHINSLNADGVLFAAVQGLAKRLNEETDRLAEENERLKRNLDAKEDRIEDLEAENDELRERLAGIEAHLGLDGASDPAPADD